jgi:hypothetical protein
LAPELSNTHRTIKNENQASSANKFKEIGGIARRHGRYAAQAIPDLSRQRRD